MSVCTPERMFWITVLDIPSSPASSRMDLVSSAIIARTNSESRSSLYSFSTSFLNSESCIQRSTVDKVFLFFAIINSCFHSLLIIIHISKRSFFFLRGHFVLFFYKCIRDNHFTAAIEKRQKAV